MDKPTFNIDKIRKNVADFQKTLCWYDKRGGLLPYDWQSYFREDWMGFLHYMKISHTGRVKKKDKRGAWR